MNGLAFLAAVLGLAAPSFAAEPPAPMAPYVEEGTLRIGDYGWARGAFDGASAADKAAWAQIVAWRDGCFDAGHADMEAELAQLGASLPEDGMLYADSPICLTSYPPSLDAFSDYAELEAASARVAPILASYLASAELAETVALEDADTLGGRLLVRRLGDNLLRRGLALIWAREDPFAGLGDTDYAVLDNMMRNAVMVHDLANREWLEAHVAEHGWPTISEVGERAALAAWLIAQHADLDPAFQLHALRLMEPLAASGEANPANFANLSDRFSLKISGTQRYGTQLVCRGQWREPQPLEDPAQVDALRASVGLGPLGEFVDMMNERGGPCTQG